MYSKQIHAWASACCECFSANRYPQGQEEIFQWGGKCFQSNCVLDSQHPTHENRSHRNQTMGFGDWSASICLLRIWLLELVPAKNLSPFARSQYRRHSARETWMKIDIKVFQDDPLSHFSNVFLVSFVFNLIKCQSPKWRSRVKQCSGWVFIMCPISGLANARGTKHCWATAVCWDLLFKC